MTDQSKLTKWQAPKLQRLVVRNAENFGARAGDGRATLKS